MVYTVNHHRNANQTTKTYHLTLVRLANIKKIRDNKYWLRYREKRILEHCWWKYNRCSYYGNNMEIPQIIKTKLPSVQFSSVQSLSCVWLLATPWISARQASCPSQTLGVYSNSCPLSRWCHPAISSSVVPFSSCPQSLSASGSFPISQLFTRCGQSIGVSASASVFPMNT